jgi:acyl-CoA thioesterase
VTTRFDRDTAVRAHGAGRFEARIDPGWFVVRGPNGGYIAAILLRALAEAVGDPARPPRSLTVHYTAPPTEGPAWIETRIERSGRSLTSVSARLLQGERLLALALAAFSQPREALSFRDATPPDVPPPERCVALPRRIPIHERFEQRWALGAPPFSGGDLALAGGWIRLAESEGQRALDAPLAAAFSDAWPPAVFGRLAEREATGGVPTIDLTIHFRSALPPSAWRPGDFALCVFRSRYARDGFLEEDGEIWSPAGELLAHSRQLALLL